MPCIMWEIPDRHPAVSIICPIFGRCVFSWKAENHDYMEVDSSHAIFEVEVPKEWIGKTVGELDIRKKYRINIIAVKNGREMNMTITPDTLLENHVSLLVLGEYKAIQKCFHI